MEDSKVLEVFATAPTWARTSASQRIEKGDNKRRLGNSVSVRQGGGWLGKGENYSVMESDLYLRKHGEKVLKGRNSVRT